MKTCPRCQVSQDTEIGFAKNNSRPDGRQSWCRSCNTATRTQWAQKRSDKVAQHRRKYRYGITEPEYQSLLTKQRNSCGICTLPFIKSPHVDHNHETGKVRGLLCSRCNTFLGYIEKNNVIDRALEYLSNAALA